MLWLELEEIPSLLLDPSCEPELELLSPLVEDMQLLPKRPALRARLKRGGQPKREEYKDPQLFNASEITRIFRDCHEHLEFMDP